MDRIFQSYQKIYLGFIKRRIHRDSILENEINKEILEGKHDDLPEQAFYMVGDIEEARASANS